MHTLSFAASVMVASIAVTSPALAQDAPAYPADTTSSATTAAPGQTVPDTSAPAATAPDPTISSYGAQDSTATSGRGSGLGSIPTSFRGVRIEGNVGGDRFQSEGRHNDKLGYGGTIGFDGTIGERFVVGAEGSFWRADDWTQNCSGVTGGTVCRRSFDEYGVAARAGVLLTPQLLVFGKGGYVSNEQRKRIDLSDGTTPVYDHYRSDGYQLGGGLEYGFSSFRQFPIYANVQYVYSSYDSHSSRQRVMAGIGLRFR